MCLLTFLNFIAAKCLAWQCDSQIREKKKYLVLKMYEKQQQQQQQQKNKKKTKKKKEEKKKEETVAFKHKIKARAYNE